MKINKKVLLILIAVVAVILLLAFTAYKYVLAPSPKVQNFAGGAKTETQEVQSQTQPVVPQVQLQAGGVQVQSAGNGGSLTICVDKCGDGICQKSDPTCKNTLNCICPETPQECPQDCK